MTIATQVVYAGGQQPVAPYQVASIGGTAIQVNSGATNANQNGIEIKGLAANSANVYIGLAGVTTSTGFQIAAGESWLVPPTFAANDGLLYVISDGSDQAVSVAVY